MIVCFLAIHNTIYYAFIIILLENSAERNIELCCSFLFEYSSSSYSFIQDYLNNLALLLKTKTYHISYNR
jgi:hypothetical protein